MLPFKRVACVLVIERPDSPGTPPAKIGVPALVVDVAGLAPAVFRPGMQTPTCVDPLLDRGVTGEAAIGGNPFSWVMTFGATRGPFEGGVGAREFTGGDLGHGRTGSEHERRDHGVAE